MTDTAPRGRPAAATMTDAAHVGVRWSGPTMTATAFDRVSQVVAIDGDD